MPDDFTTLLERRFPREPRAEEGFTFGDPEMQEALRGASEAPPEQAAPTFDQLLSVLPDKRTKEPTDFEAPDPAVQQTRGRLRGTVAELDISDRAFETGDPNVFGAGTVSRPIGKGPILIEGEQERKEAAQHARVLKPRTLTPENVADLSDYELLVNLDQMQRDLAPEQRHPFGNAFLKRVRFPEGRLSKKEQQDYDFQRLMLESAARDQAERIRDHVLGVEDSTRIADLAARIGTLGFLDGQTIASTVSPEIAVREFDAMNERADDAFRTIQMGASAVGMLVPVGAAARGISRGLQAAGLTAAAAERVAIPAAFGLYEFSRTPGDVAGRLEAAGHGAALAGLAQPIAGLFRVGLQRGAEATGRAFQRTAGTRFAVSGAGTAEGAAADFLRVMTPAAARVMERTIRGAPRWAVPILAEAGGFPAAETLIRGATGHPMTVEDLKRSAVLGGAFGLMHAARGGGRKAPTPEETMRLWGEHVDRLAVREGAVEAPRAPRGGPERPKGPEAAREAPDVLTTPEGPLDPALTRPAPTPEMAIERTGEVPRNVKGPALIDPGKLDAGVAALRGEGSPSRPLPKEAGVVDPVAAAKAIGMAPLEAAGFVKRAISKPLDVGDAGARALLRQVKNTLPVRKLGQVGKALRETAETHVPQFSRDREFRSRLAEMNAETALGQHDARLASKWLGRTDGGKALSRGQHELAQRYLEGEGTTRAEVEAGVGREFARNLEQIRQRITEGSRELADLGWMSRETLAEWEGKYLPRLFRTIEEAKAAGDLPSGPRQGSKRVPPVFRRKSRYDIFAPVRGGERIIASFKTQAEADAFVTKIRSGERLGREAREDLARGMEEQARVSRETIPPEIDFLRPKQRALASGVTQTAVRWVERGPRGGVKEKSRTFDDPVDAEAFRGELESLKAERRAGLDEAGLFEREAAQVRRGLRDVKPEQLRVQEPLSQEALARLGEIRDVDVRVAKALVTQRSTVAVFRFLNDIASNPRWARADRPHKGFHEDPLPNDPKKYGALAGKYLHRGIRKDITGLLRERIPVWDTVAEFSDTLLAQWKWGKTVGNPGTHGRNILGNVTFMELDGFSAFDPSNMKHMAEGVRIWAAQDGSRLELKRFLIRERILGTDFLSSEVLKIADEMLRYRGRTWKDKAVNYVQEKAQDFAKGRVFTSIPGTEAMTFLYRAEDILPKIGAWVQKVRRGMDPHAAAHEVRQNYPQYDAAITQRLMMRRGLGGAGARQLAPPFFTFTAEAARILSRQALRRPVTMAAMALALDNASEIMHGIAGVEPPSEEELARMKATAPSYRTPGLLNTVLPWRGENGEIRVLDLTYTIPMGAEGRALVDLLRGEDPWDENAVQSLPTGPFAAVAVQLAFNRNLFAGRAIDRSRGEDKFTATSDPQGERDTWEFIGESMLPSLFPGVGYNWNKLSEALEQKPIDLEGKVTRNKTLTMLDTLAGVKIREIDPKRDLSMRVRQIDSLLEKKLNRIRAIARDARIPEWDRRREYEELRADIVRLWNEGLRARGMTSIHDFMDLPRDVRRRAERNLTPKERRSRQGPMARFLGIEDE